MIIKWWLSVEEIAEYFGVKNDSIYNWINERGMPTHKVGRLWKFQTDEVNEGFAQEELPFVIPESSGANDN